MTGSEITPHDFPFVHTAALEVTSKCNLRCTYCAVSQPGYRGLDMADGMIAEVLTELRARGLAQLCINGHGETTASRGWCERFKPLLDEFAISIITNLAKRLNQDEIDFLSRIDSVNVSLDTVDAGLLRLVRRATDLEVVVGNLRAIRAAAAARHESEPRFVLYSGIYDRNVMGLEALAGFAAAFGFSRVVFWNLVKYPDIPGATNVNALSTLHPDVWPKARVAIAAATGVLDAHNIDYEFVGDCFPTATAAANHGEGVSLTRGLTRQCFDPWNYSQIKATGEIYPCCAHRPIGRIDEHHRYRDVLGGTELKVLRRGLLTGELDEDCRNCQVRPSVPVEDFQAQYCSTFRVSLRSSGAITIPPWQTPRPSVLASWAGRLRSVIRTAATAVWTRRIVARLDAPVTGSLRGRRVVVSGWSFTPDGRPVSGRIFAGDIYCADLIQNRERPDVQHAFAGRIPLLCGFAVTIRVPDAIAAAEPFIVRIVLDSPGLSSRALSSGPLRVGPGEGA